LRAAEAVFLIENAADPRSQASAVATAFAIATVFFVLVATARLREPEHSPGLPTTSAFDAFRYVLRNPHARLLVLVFFLD